jgi:putative addiction module component (TIGR02574 family)
MLQEVIPTINELSTAEKLVLLEELWDNVAARPDEVLVPDWQREELESSYAEYLANPEEGSTWEEVRERILQRLG